MPLSQFFLSLAFKNSICGTIPSAYDRWRQIEYFDLNGNSIKGTIPPSFCNWNRSLAVFSVFDNLIHGTISPCLLGGAIQQLLIHDNNIAGSLPFVVGTKLETLAASNNQLKGPLPNLGQAASLQTCVLHSNLFKGHVSALNLATGAQTHLRTLTLHNNSLSGSLTPLSGLNRSLTFLTLSDNAFTGRVPNDISLREDATLTLQRNRLSCQLPKGLLGQGGVNLILPGNAFDGPPPDWVEYPADPLCVSQGLQSEWAVIALSGAAYLVIFALASTFALRARRQDTQSRSLTDDRGSLEEEDTRADRLLPDEEDEEPPPQDHCFAAAARLLCRWALEWSQEAHDDENLVQQLRLLRIAFGGLAALTVFAAVLVTPVPLIGAKYFECGDPFVKFATLAYLADSATAETLAAVSFCCVGVVIAVLVARLYDHSVRMREAAFAFQRSLAHATDANDQRPLRRRVARWCTACAALVTWGLGILTVNGLTVLYLATQAMPEENSVPVFIVIGGATFIVVCALLLHAQPPSEDAILVSSVQQDEHEDDASTPAEQPCSRRRKMIIAAALLTGGFMIYLLLLGVSAISVRRFRVPPTAVQFLQSAVPILMSAINSLVIPAMTKPLARLIVGRRGHDLSSAMVLIARVAGTVFIPIVALIFFDDGCMQQWRTIWTPCLREHKKFDAAVDLTYSASGGSGSYDSVTSPISLMTSAEVCSGLSPLESIDHGRCGRSILGVWLPLLVKKALFAAFGQPAMLLIVVSCARLRKWLLWVVVTEEKQQDGGTTIVRPNRKI